MTSHMTSQQLALDLEWRATFLSADKWDQAPKHVFDIAEKLCREGISTAICHDDELGWCVLFTGQGPGVAYVENERPLK